jgi:hypothetical protein
MFRTYGSGYSGFSTRGVAGRPFPFYFWPVVWGGGALLATGAYLDERHEVSATQIHIPFLLTDELLSGL